MLTPQPMATSSIRVRPTFQPSGLDDVEQDDHDQGERRPARPTNEIIAGAMPETSTAKGSSTHSRTVWSATPIMMAEPTTNPMAVPPTARSAVAPVPERVGAQHRQGAEHDPEAVLDVRDLDDGDGERQPGRAPHRVAEPDRAEREVGERAGATAVRRPCAGHGDPAVLDGSGAGRLERGVGHQPHGDPERAGMKARVERVAGDAVRVPRARSPASGSAFSDSDDEGRHVGGQLRTRRAHRGDGWRPAGRRRGSGPGPGAPRRRRSVPPLFAGCPPQPRSPQWPGRAPGQSAGPWRSARRRSAGRVARDPLDAADELGERDRAGGRAGGRIRGGRELRAQARQLASLTSRPRDGPRRRGPAHRQAGRSRPRPQTGVGEGCRAKAAARGRGRP